MSPTAPLKVGNPRRASTASVGAKLARVQVTRMPNQYRYGVRARSGGTDAVGAVYWGEAFVAGTAVGQARTDKDGARPRIRIRAFRVVQQDIAARSAYITSSLRSTGTRAARAGA